MGGLGLIFVAVLALAIAAGAIYQWIGAARDARRLPALGRMIDTGYRRLHAQIQGKGGPPVVFEAGIAATSLSWSSVQSEVAKRVQTISYDRAGLGWSDPAASCGIDTLLADLRELLSRAQVASPRILVGHSFGGLIALIYAARYPQEVAGVVLVDPAGSSEWADPNPTLRATRSRGIFLARVGEVLARLGVVRFALNLASHGAGRVPRLIARASSGRGGAAFTERMLGEIRKLPREAWPAVQSHWSDPKSFRTAALSLEMLPASAAAVLREVERIEAPVIVLSAGSSSLAQRADHERLARTVLRGRLEIVQDSGHWMMLDRPDAVVSAIRELTSSDQ